MGSTAAPPGLLLPSRPSCAGHGPSSASLPCPQLPSPAASESCVQRPRSKGIEQLRLTLTGPRECGPRGVQTQQGAELPCPAGARPAGCCRGRARFPVPCVVRLCFSVWVLHLPSASFVFPGRTAQSQRDGPVVTSERSRERSPGRSRLPLNKPRFQKCCLSRWGSAGPAPPAGAAGETRGSYQLPAGLQNLPAWQLQAPVRVCLSRWPPCPEGRPGFVEGRGWGDPSPGGPKAEALGSSRGSTSGQWAHQRDHRQMAGPSQAVGENPASPPRSLSGH